MRRLDLTSLVGGVALLVIGLFLLLDGTGEVDLTLGWTASLVLAGAGATLLVGGLRDGS
ncbi:hypothetical protein [Paraconexibacter algicola]|uniref:hypothetical protein n=1 Tax=Paraconexibacter algicola TaxID=2133960 RepID=UPI001304A1B7|nr:hypothetical protein [Paraconexibacter algicola]